VSTAPRYLPRYTVSDRASWEGDWELLDGVALAMTPSPFGRHAERLSRLAAILWNAIDASGCRATVLAELDWVVTNDTVVRPDLVVVCGPAPEGHVEQPPAFVAEILSAATRTRDLTVKRDLYEANGVRWYLISDPDEGRSSLLRLDPSGRYESLSAGGRQEVDLCPVCTLSIDFGGSEADAARSPATPDAGHT
jgi:Uma2 family endonuclease